MAVTRAMAGYASNFPNLLDAQHWYGVMFGNKTLKEIELSWKVYPEALITFNQICKGELKYYGRCN